MRRTPCPPRSNWQQRVECLGFDFHTLPSGPYWLEDRCYRFHSEEIDLIEAVGDELHAMCMDLVADVSRLGDWDRLGLSVQASGLAEASWRRGEQGLYGRMDLAYEGKEAPKLLEYNADTPTALFEASVVQWHWLEETRLGADQFNLIHESLLARWTQIATLNVPTHFVAATASLEDRGTLGYLAETYALAGGQSVVMDIADIGYLDEQFVDLDDKPIQQLFKLYPWEWLLQDSFATHIANTPTRWIEPAWKQALSNKRVLPLLWQRHPGHPNLLPAALSPQGLKGEIVVKPQFGREGEGVRLYDSEAANGDDIIYQERAKLFEANGRHALLGLWLIGDKAVGMGVREDEGWITRNTSCFVPHCID